MYVVFGATGQTGSVVVDTLLEKKIEVRVVLRSAKTADAWQAKGAEIVLADVNNVEAMTEAMQNADAVYAINPPAYNVTDMSAVAREIGERYVAAVKNSGAQKVGRLSSVGSQHAESTGNILTTHILEEIFSDLEFPVAFLRAASFMENWGGVAKIAAEQGVLSSFYTPLDRKIPQVSTADIGRTAALLMIEDWTGKRIVELHGAADCSPNDVANAFAVALGRNVQAVAIPESEWLATISRFGFLNEAADNYSEMMRGFNSGHIVFEGGSRVETIKGKMTIAGAVGKITEKQI